MIELNLDTMALDADTPSNELLDAGAPPQVHVQIIGGSELPFADPRDQSRPLRYPSLTVNFQMGREEALKFASLIEEKAKSLPNGAQTSKLAIVSDLNEAGKVVQFDKTLRGK